VVVEKDLEFTLGHGTVVAQVEQVVPFARTETLIELRGTDQRHHLLLGEARLNLPHVLENGEGTATMQCIGGAGLRPHQLLRVGAIRGDAVT